jgi:4-diphosphocytidyl-2-C-methyl-D-erythritol kinase
VTTVSRPAHAKLNAFLRVLGRRDDGFHDVETLILPLELHDVVTVSPSEALTVEVTGPRAGALVASGGETLAAAAAQALAEPCPARHGHGAAIRIDKRIPVGAGLGGGSADAAATILALRELWGCELDDTGLVTIAASLGSDVPALLRDEPVYCTGRGEVVHPAHAQTTYWVVRPFPFAIAAADAYAWWDEDGAETGPDPGALVAALESGNDELTGHALSNDLQGPVVRRHPEIGEVIEAFLAAGALGAAVTGSGPTVVALARHLGHADRLAEAIDGSFVTSGPPRTMAGQSGVV